MTLRKNGNYTILSAFSFPELEFEVVLAENDSYKSYVTWIYNIKYDSYFWGHYFNDYKKALTDYTERITNEVEIYNAEH